jgi:alpha-tubulin suppressor-like RCC1 family protein
LTPVPVAGLSSGVQSIFTGYHHSCALANGGLYCWGYNVYAQIGNGTTTSPVLAPTLVSAAANGTTAVGAGGYFTCAVSNGTLRCWGNGGSGQMGNGLAAGTQLTPVSPSNLANVVGLAAGGTHVCAIGGLAVGAAGGSGNTFCWGNNSNGQVGNGSTSTSVLTPALISLIGAPPTQALAAGSASTYALANNGAQGWGADLYGQAGSPSGGNVFAPYARLGWGTNVLRVAPGSQHTCLLQDDTLQCLGYGLNGELGNGLLASSPSSTVLVKEMWP